MKKLVSMILGVFFIVGLSTIGYAEVKIGFFSLGKIMSESEKVKQINTEMESKFKTYETERNKKIEEIKELQNKFNLLSDKEKVAKKTEIENKIKDFETYDRQKLVDLKKEGDEKGQEFHAYAMKIISDYAIEKGYTLILSDTVITYVDDKLDISDDILKRLNSKSVGKGKK